MPEAVVEITLWGIIHAHKESNNCWVAGNGFEYQRRRTVRDVIIAPAEAVTIVPNTLYEELEVATTTIRMGQSNSKVQG
jgi:hypothetical protein